MRNKKFVAPFKFKQFSPKQMKLLYWWNEHSPYKDYDIIIADGAIRSGKTISMICSFLTFTQSNFQGENFIIAGKTIGSLKRNVIQPMIQILNSWRWNFVFNRSDNYIVIGTNTYYLFGANTEASQDSLQGMTSAGAFADEIALFPQSFTEQMIGRCSVEGSKLFFNCNPRSPHHYFKKDYIDKAEDKKIYYLHFDMDDNLSLANEVKERYKRMFTGVFYKRYILGMWVQAEGVIYDMFNESLLFKDTEHKEYSEYHIACDYGTQNPMVFLLFGRYQDKWYLVKEYYYDGRAQGRQKTDEEYYNDMVDFVGDLTIQSIIIDPSASSFITCIRKHGRFYVRKGKNEVVKGIRNVSTNLMQKKILICETCENTIKEFYSYSWDDKALERGEDEPLKVNDHAMDCLRYFVMTVIGGNGTSILK